MAPPPLQALISILLLLEASMLLVADESPAPPPSGGGYIFKLKRAGGNAEVHDMTFQTGESSVSAVADTGSDLVWLKGQNNICLSDPIRCGDQCSDLGMDNVKCCLDHCMFERKYGEGSFARGFMVKSNKVETIEHDKTLTVGCAVNFGCESVNKQDCRLYNTGGIVGLGRGKMSVLSQLVEKKKFSFCLPGDPEVTSKIKFGDQAAAPRPEQAGGQVKFIADASKYYVNLKNIQFEKDLQEKPMGDRRMLIDSGCSLSKLPMADFEELKKRVEERLGKPKKDVTKSTKEITCYEWDDDGKHILNHMPEMVLEFDGGNKLSLPWENYVRRGRSSPYLCLAIKQGDLTLGNFQMRNIAMLFDLTKGPGTLAFWPDDCAMH